jgi:hypothetical protein
MPPPVDSNRFEYPPSNPIWERFEPVSPTEFDIFVRSCYPGNVSDKRVHNPAGLQDTCRRHKTNISIQIVTLISHKGVVMLHFGIVWKVI